MLHALILGLRQLADPAVQRLLLRCVLLTLATFLALIGAVAALLFGLDLTGLAWLDPVLATAGSALVLVLAWLLFPIVVALTLGLFAEDVVAIVERRHYPELPKAPGMSLAAQAYAGVRFVTVALLLNLIALPLVAIAFMVHLVTPGLWRAAGNAGRPRASVAELKRNPPGGRQKDLTSLKGIVNQTQAGFGVC